MGGWGRGTLFVAQLSSFGISCSEPCRPVIQYESNYSSASTGCLFLFLLGLSTKTTFPRRDACLTALTNFLSLNDRFCNVMRLTRVAHNRPPWTVPIHAHPDLTGRNCETMTPSFWKLGATILLVRDCKSMALYSRSCIFRRGRHQIKGTRSSAGWATNWFKP